MTKRIGIKLSIFLLILLCLTACTREPLMLKVDNPSLLEVPGLKWNVTPEEVKSALNLTSNKLVVEEVVDRSDSLSEYDYDEYLIIAKDISFFGHEVKGAYFFFYRYTGNEYGLGRVELYYPDDTDFDTIINTLVSIYGEGDTTSGIYSINAEGDLDYMDTTADSTAYYRKWWESNTSILEAFTEEAQDAILDHFTGEFSRSSQETIQRYMETWPATVLRCAEKGDRAAIAEKNGNVSPYISHKNLIFQTVRLVELIQKYGK